MGNKQSMVVRLLPLLGCRKGQAVVEMTFGFIIFLAFFLAIVEFSHLLYAKVTLQHALRTAGRYMITGRTQMNQQGNPLPRDQVIHDLFCTNVIAAGVQCPALGSGNFTFACLPTGTACTEGGGGPNQTVLVTVNVQKPTLMPFFSQFFPVDANGVRGVSLQLSTTWKNEPFPTS
jgi:Flp pilus assembly protein TadG